MAFFAVCKQQILIFIFRLDNSNLLYALTSHPVKIGTVRETFAVNFASVDSWVLILRAPSQINVKIV